MKSEILTNLDNPRQLEKLYRDNKPTFKREFNTLYPQLSESPYAHVWNARLNYDDDGLSWGSTSELLFILVSALLAGTTAKLPQILSIPEEFFYTRNVGFILFPFLIAYFVWKRKADLQNRLLLGGLLLAALIFINLLPDTPKSDTLALSMLHLPLFLWSLLCVAFAGGFRHDLRKRLDYLSFNGELIIMTGLILITGGLLTGITIGLFTLIGLRIEEFYFQYVVIFGLSAAPLVGTYLTQTNPQLVNRVSPVIARLFCPLVLVTLVAYLIAILIYQKDPYNDREFLILFNVLLVGVMAIIFFSVAESTRSSIYRIEHLLLFLLSVVTIIVNGIALSAILFRISEWGFTPNRTVVLGSNILILVNLVLVTGKLYGVVASKKDISEVGRTIAAYLPLYFLWAAIVTFLFPFLFGFK
ncbi:hypothetical protein [Telluribacter sp. SYSU D00476]|uniref:hypothetical protein n=1 Tax=Telluribacter sp. SYSU D00476 TaxID=2811430 RepID=UPI001FF117B9|nr:hypothetical protein [Telluribacter sp. SYSU D00476]